jgi:hypothetical protein
MATHAARVGRIEAATRPGVAPRSRAYPVAPAGRLVWPDLLKRVWRRRATGLQGARMSGRALGWELTHVRSHISLWTTAAWLRMSGRARDFQSRMSGRGFTHVRSRASLYLYVPVVKTYTMSLFLHQPPPKSPFERRAPSDRITKPTPTRHEDAPRRKHRDVGCVGSCGSERAIRNVLRAYHTRASKGIPRHVS